MTLPRPAASPVIVAGASAPGRSPRAIVRVSGEGIAAVLEESGATVPRARGTIPTQFELPGPRGARTLPLLLAWLPGPHSYTGEDGAELYVPGHPDLVTRIVEAVLAAAARRGIAARRADPGEFTARAYLNGRMDLAQAEGVAHTIAAQSEAELRAARQLRSGALGRLALRLAEAIADVLALVEAGIDFTDEEDVVAIAPGEARRRIHAAQVELQAVLRSAVSIERLEATPRVVLAGAANAGKSTLFNALIGRERAIVSVCAGTTRDAIVEPITLSTPIGPAEILLIDVAGEETSADARDALHAAMRRQAVAAATAADLILRCVPAGTPLPEGVDGARTIVVRTKADLAPGHPAPGDPSPESGAGLESVAVAALAGAGLDTLRDAIARRLAGAITGLSAAAVALAPRHEAHLRSAMRACSAAQEELAATTDDAPAPELVAAALRLALDDLGSVAGAVTPDDVLGRIFAGFCIGK